MMELVTPLIEKGGCDTVFVMPNLQPPVKTVADALAYHEKLSRLAPNVKFLMSLYLHPGLTPETIAEAAKTGVIYGVSCACP
jgi:dihydroorotase